MEGVLGDRYGLPLHVGAVGWSCRLKLWIKVGQSYGSEVLAGVGATGQSHWLGLLDRVFDLSC